MTKRIIGNIFTYIAMLALALLTLIPLIYVFSGAFKSNMELMAYPDRLFPKEIVFDNFVQIFNSEQFDALKMFVNSVYYSSINVVVSVLFSTMAAYAFARGEFPGKKVVFAIFSALLFINLGSIAVYPLFEILGKIKLSASLNSLLVLKTFSVYTVYIHLIRAYIKGIPRELDEAAKLDGCGEIGILFRIILPLLKPIIATIVILSFQSSWNEYIMPQIFTASYPDQRTLTVGIVALKNSGEGAASNNLMLTGACVSVLPVLIVYCLGNKFFVSGLSAGAVKG